MSEPTCPVCGRVGRVTTHRQRKGRYAGCDITHTWHGGRLHPSGAGTVATDRCVLILRDEQMVKCEANVSDW